MATITQMRSGIAANLAKISGLRTATTVPDVINPPMAIVVPNSITFDRSFKRGTDEYEFAVIVIASRADERTAQTKIDGYCSPTGAGSVKAAIESDRSLGGVIQDLRVTEMRAYGPADIGGVTYLTAEFVVSVFSQ